MLQDAQYITFFPPNSDTLKINPKDIRWVGAWWLGLLICGAVCLVASLPFCFLPHSLPKEGDSEKKPTEVFAITKEIHCKMESPGKPQLQVSEAVKGLVSTSYSSLVDCELCDSGVIMLAVIFNLHVLLISSRKLKRVVQVLHLRC